MKMMSWEQPCKNHLGRVSQESSGRVAEHAKTQFWEIYRFPGDAAGVWRLYYNLFAADANEPALALHLPASSATPR